MKVYVDQGVDQPRLSTLQKQYGFKIVQGQSLEQNIKIAEGIPNVAVWDVSLWYSNDYFADDDVNDVEAELGKDKGVDTAHIYSAYHAGCEYFVTNNPDDFIYTSKRKKDNGRREKLEEILKGLKIVTLKEFEEILASL